MKQIQDRLSSCLYSARILEKAAIPIVETRQSTSEIRNLSDPRRWNFVRGASQNYTIVFTELHVAPCSLTCLSFAENVDARRPCRHQEQTTAC